jgi:hypothetical protein
MAAVGIRRRSRHTPGPVDPAEPLVPLVVDSSGRSGTTMTMALLASSPQVAMDRRHPYEHRYFAWLVEWSALADATEWDLDRWNGVTLVLRQLGVQADGLIGPPPWLPRPLWEADDEEGGMAAPLLVSAWREFSLRATGRTERELGGSNVRYHAEKATDVRRLRELYPGAVKSVMLHRDPRDVWLSIQAFDRARGFYGFGRHPDETEEDWLTRFLDAQLQRSRAVLAEREGADSLLLAYEDLVSRPEAAATRLGQWLGLELDPEAPARDLALHGDHATSASPDVSVARWRQELSPGLRDRFATEMGPELRALGYEA